MSSPTHDGVAINLSAQKLKNASLLHIATIEHV